MRTLYLHGFLSSPESMKGKKLRQAHQKAGIPFDAPVLHCSPKDAAGIIEDMIRGFCGDDFCVVGSSLGGFYATWVAENYGVPAVLLNPAVRPWNFMADKIGIHTITGTDKTIEVVPEYDPELRAMGKESITKPQRYLTILGDADEVLDWRDGAKFYAEARQIVVKGGDHRLSDFDPLIPEIMEFINSR